eukprot:Pgem_evm1s13776
MINTSNNFLVVNSFPSTQTIDTQNKTLDENTLAELRYLEFRSWEPALQANITKVFCNKFLNNLTADYKNSIGKLNETEKIGFIISLKNEQESLTSFIVKENEALQSIVGYNVKTNSYIVNDGNNKKLEEKFDIDIVEVKTNKTVFLQNKMTLDSLRFQMEEWNKAGLGNMTSIVIYQLSYELPQPYPLGLHENITNENIINNDNEMINIETKPSLTVRTKRTASLLTKILKGVTKASDDGAEVMIKANDEAIDITTKKTAKEIEMEALAKVKSQKSQKSTNTPSSIADVTQFAIEKRKLIKIEKHKADLLELQAQKKVILGHFITHQERGITKHMETLSELSKQNNEVIDQINIIETEILRLADAGKQNVITYNNQIAIGDLLKGKDGIDINIDNILNTMKMTVLERKELTEALNSIRKNPYEQIGDTNVYKNLQTGKMLELKSSLKKTGNVGVVAKEKKTVHGLHFKDVQIETFEVSKYIKPRMRKNDYSWSPDIAL